jgi:hypothetical protein
MFRLASLTSALQLLGEVLAERGEKYEVVAIGGAGLQMLGVIDRPTQDLDLLALLEGAELVEITGALPDGLQQAITDVARVLGLSDDWMNSKPSQTMQFGLPEGFQSRLERRAFGALGLSLASRLDQIHFKLYAAVDDSPRGKHFADLRKLKPTRDELLTAADWAKTHDTSEPFALLVEQVIEACMERTR